MGVFFLEKIFWDIEFVQGDVEGEITGACGGGFGGVWVEFLDRNFGGRLGNWLWLESRV